MGSLYTTIIKRIVDKVGAVILRYEADNSFARIAEDELIFIPKSYLKTKVKACDLEFILDEVTQGYTTR